MSIMSSASGASLWRCYEYFTVKKVTSFTKISDDEFEGKVKGSRTEPYHVKINTTHIRQSKCDCPHAFGKRIICKHMVASHFTAFPRKAEDYQKEVEKNEREEEEREQNEYEEVREYVYSLIKEELREELIHYIIDLEKDRHY